MPQLVIVSRDRPSLYEYFKTHMERAGEIWVVLDRRIGERRQEAIEMPSERRRGPRRISLTPRQATELEELGFTIVEL